MCWTVLELRAGKAPLSHDSSADVVLILRGTKDDPSSALLPIRMCCPLTRLAASAVLGREVTKT